MHSHFLRRGVSCGTYSEGTQAIPCSTLVLYFGTERHWTAPKTLLERLEVNENLLPFVQNYGINLFELAWLSDEQIAAFKSDFREVVEYLCAKRLHLRYDGSSRQLRHIEEILEIFRVMSGEKSFDNIKTEMLSQAKEKSEKVATDRLLSVFAKLRSSGNYDVLDKAISDREYLQNLLDTYQA